MLFAALLSMFLLVMAHTFGYLPLSVLAIYGVVSLMSVVSYGFDKHAAIRGEHRVPEIRLQLLALLGGWPGAMLAQPVFRHKRRKLSFMIAFWLVSLLNVGILLSWLAWRNGLLSIE